MSSDLFIPIKFKTNVILKPNEFDSNFETTIIKKIKLNYENICSKYGYIKQNSIKLVKRSVGVFTNQHFNSNAKFSVICIAEICNPVQGSIIKCRVKNVNKMGVLAEGFYDKIPILEIIIPTNSAGIKSEINLDTLVKGQEIKIEVCGKKYQLFDKYISIIGRAIKNKDENIKNDFVNVDGEDEPDDDMELLNDDIVELEGSEKGDNYESDDEVDNEDKKKDISESESSDESDNEDKSEKSEEYVSGGEEFDDTIEYFDDVLDD